MKTKIVYIVKCGDSLARPPNIGGLVSWEDQTEAGKYAEKLNKGIRSRVVRALAGGWSWRAVPITLILK